jgi:large subunit ribosomal protein L28
MSGMKCFNCGKGVMYGHAVSHAKNRTNRLFKPNLHAFKMIEDGRSSRVRLCTKCLRMIKKKMNRAVSAKVESSAIKTFHPAHRQTSWF